jgi:hypothetical protein
VGEWFVPRPVAEYRARWLGDNLAEVEGDVLLPERLTFQVREGGELRVTDPVLGLVQDVPVGAWFTEQQWWSAAQLEATYQQVTSLPPWTFVITGGGPPVTGGP